MAKKVKRKVSQVTTAATASEPGVTQDSSVATAAARSSFSRRSTNGTVAEFNPDYTYVVNDLKRIGLLASTFFVVLIILSFIIK